MVTSQPAFPQALKKFFVLMFLVAIALPLAAQTGLGVVHGTVTDQSHAVIPNAKVTLTNTATGVTQTVQTTAVGAYYFGSVQQGPYTVTVEIAHFKKWTGTFKLDVGQDAVVDPAMEVGSVDVAVQVTDAAPIIETEKGTLSDVKDALRIEELPLNGRQVTNLFNLTPGVEGGGAPHTNGMKVGSTDMSLDGISMQARFGGGIDSVQPGLDIVQEFRFETSGSDAAFSRPASVTLVSKSGSNQFHGDAFETNRDNYGGLVARKIQDGNKPAQYIRNEYGGIVSGPVVKNKAFFMYSYEGMKLRQGLYTQAQVLTDSIWNGNFAGETDYSGNNYTIYDPNTSGPAPGYTRSPFPNNQIPAARLSAFSKALKAVSPEPTIPNVDPWVTINYQVNYPLTQDFDTQTARFDYVLSAKDNMSVRWTHSNQNNVQAGGHYGFPPLGCNNCGGSSTRIYGLTSGVVREVHVFKPTLLNEFQVSVNRSPSHEGVLSDNTDWADKLGVPNPFGAKGWPTIYADYYNNDGQMMYWDSDNLKDQKETQYQLDDNVTWIKGKHTFQFGFRGRIEDTNVREMQQAEGQEAFHSEWTGLYNPANPPQVVSYTGDGFADIELGLPTSLNNEFNRGYFYFRQKEFGTYFQDSWKVNQRLTVNYGLRWDKWTPYTEKYNRFVNLDMNAVTATNMQVITPYNASMTSLPNIPASVLAAYAARGVTWVTADQAGLPGALIPGINHDFGPRLGVAYKVTDHWVVRASYGIYYWPMPLSQILQTSRTNVPLNLLFSNVVVTHNGTNYVYGQTSAPAPTDYVDQATVTATAVAPTSQYFTPLDFRHWNDDTMQQWTFVIERQLAKNTSARVSYIGNHGSGLEQRWAWNDPTALYNYRATTGLIGPPADPNNPDLRRPNPNWTGYGALEHNGYSNTQSIQFEFNHRFSHGLTAQAFYTYAHAMTTTDAGGSQAGDGNINSNGPSYAYEVPMNSEILGDPNLTPDQRLRLGYTNSGDVPPQHVRWNGVYELPFGKGKQFGKNIPGWLDQAIGGWSISFIGDWSSGFWMGVNSGLYMFGNPTLSKGQRVTTNIFGAKYQVYFKGYFDSSQAATNAAAVQALVPVNPYQRVLTKLGAQNDQVAQTLADGSVVYTSTGDMVNWNARNFYQGPGQWNQDARLQKAFAYKERYKLLLAGDFFNVFNHPNITDLNTSQGLMNLGVQANAARIIQLSAKFEF